MDGYYTKTSWYKKWWGMILLSFFAFIIIIILLFIFFTFKYVSDIKNGQGTDLNGQFYGSVASMFGGGEAQYKQKRNELETADDPFKGNPTAKIVIVEFIDFMCSNCKTADPIMKKVISNYGHQVKLITRDFPIESLHSGTSKYSNLAHCAHKQNRFWQMHDAIFTNQESLPENMDDQIIKTLSNLASVDYSKIKQCLENKQTTVEVDQDYANGLKYGVMGTPTFFINGVKISGVVSYEQWEKFLKE